MGLACAVTYRDTHANTQGRGLAASSCWVAIYRTQKRFKILDFELGIVFVLIQELS